MTTAASDLEAHAGAGRPSSPTLTLLTNAIAVLPDRTRPDTAVLLEDGLVRAIEPASVPPRCEEIDLDGRILMPGLVDLHSDAVELEAEPRPGVSVPFGKAAAQIDLRCASLGITTCFHSISFATKELGLREPARADDLARSLHAFNPLAMTDLLVHARYEITDPDALPHVERLVDDRVAALVSVMDHTPGQGQYKDVTGLRDWFMRRLSYSEAEADALIEQKLGASTGAWDRLTSLARHAAAAGVPVASHDDDTPQRVPTLKDLGVTISEFPMTTEAAEAIGRAGIAVLVGAPNVIRGKSHGSGPSARELFRAGLAHAICADYAPAMLLPAVFTLARDAGLPLHQAAAAASGVPAAAARMPDRGTLAAGQRADLIAVGNLDGRPAVERVYTRGRLVFMAQRADRPAHDLVPPHPKPPPGA